MIHKELECTLQLKTENELFLLLKLKVQFSLHNLTNIQVSQYGNKMRITAILHDIKLNFGFFQAANNVIKLIIAKLMADIGEQNDTL